jgi:hypothetical protein
MKDFLETFGIVGYGIGVVGITLAVVFLILFPVVLWLTFAALNFVFDFSIVVPYWNRVVLGLVIAMWRLFFSPNYTGKKGR